MSEKNFGLNPVAVAKIQQDLQNNNKSQESPIIQASDKIEKLIYNDTLTGFENRRGLNRYKDNLENTQYPLTIITFDLDNLKKINDNPDPEKGGHTGGDKYILSFVKFIDEVFPDIKKFRLGGDEFSIPLKKEELVLYQKKIETLLQLLKDFNKREQNPNDLEFTYASDIATSGEDFYPGLKRSDDKLVKTKEVKKSQLNLSSQTTTNE